MLDVEQIYGGKKVTFILPNVALTVLLFVPPLRVGYRWKVPVEGVLVPTELSAASGMRLVILPVRHDGAQSSPAFVLPCLEITCRIVLFSPTHHSPQQCFLSPASPCNSIRMPRVFVVWSFFFASFREFK